MTFPGPTPSPAPSPKPNAKPGGGTISPEAAAAIAGFSAGAGSTSKSGVITGVSLGVDPVTGKQIFATDKEGNVVSIFPQGAEQSIIKLLPPKERIALQKQLLAIGAYPEGFRPSGDGMVTQEDFNAIAKLIAVGEQKGIGDINAVIKLAKSDKVVGNFLKTGGYTSTSTVSITDTLEASATLNDFFLNMFNEKPSKDEVKAYQSALNAREKSSKGAMSAQERQDILFSVANKRISTAAAGALAGDIDSAEMLDSGQIGRRVRELRAAYEENGMKVGDKTLYNLAGKSFRSPEAYDNILEDITQNAAIQWGDLGKGLKPGQTVRTRLQPYISLWSNISGIPEDDIKTADLEDVMNADGTFKRPQEYKNIKYKSKEYLGSDRYKQTVLDDTQAVLRNFGIG
jgi:hypothetical protein